MKRTDYDKIAHLYDERARDHVADEALLDFLSTRGSFRQSTPCVLDVGCGAGKQLAANHERLSGVAFVGIDRFQGMLRIARQRCPEIAWIQADGASLPLVSQACDYATSQFSYPHVRNTAGLLNEIFRVLRPGGRFVMTNIDPWSMTNWAIYRYFPEALALDCQDFLPVGQFLDLMRAVGFQGVSARQEERSSWRDAEEFLAFASDRHRASQLMAISNEAYTAGLQRLIRDTQLRSNFISQFVLVTITGDKCRPRFTD